MAPGKIVLNRAPVDLAQAVERCIGTLTGMGKLDEHALTLEVDSVWVEADVFRLDQILMNLVANATRYTPGGGSIRVSVGRDAGEALLRVAHSGVGGLGVGLTLVQELVELHGGRVEVESAGPGQGSVFTVRLPAIAVPSEAHGVVAPGTAPSAQRRVLVIEDNQDRREMMRLLLEMSGHEVHAAADGPSGVEAATRLQPDVALIDVGLPGIDGHEVARRIRSAPGGERPVLLALTGYGQQEDRKIALAAGIDDHLVKPVDPARLSAVLATARKLAPPG